LGFGYGATEWWFTEAYLKFEKNPGGRTQYDACEWENKFQLTEPNRYAVDVGLITEMGYQLQARYSLRRELEVGVQAFGDMGKWNHWEPSDEQNHRIGPAVSLSSFSSRRYWKIAAARPTSATATKTHIS
jgi:hypothetical protein